jgi:hypothetical protein
MNKEVEDIQSAIDLKRRVIKRLKIKDWLLAVTGEHIEK